MVYAKCQILYVRFVVFSCEIAPGGAVAGVDAKPGRRAYATLFLL
jgi:hypothetical protein